MNLPKKYVVFLLNWNAKKMAVDLFVTKPTKHFDHVNPLIIGRAFFFEDKNGLRPFKFLNLKTHLESFYRPDDVTKVLKNAEYIIFNKSEEPWNLKGILDYFKTFMIPKPKQGLLCSFCAEQKKITILINDVYRVYGRPACKTCVDQQLKKELRSRGVMPGPSVWKFVKKRLKETKEVASAIELLNRASKYQKNATSTLYDVIPGEIGKTVPIDSLNFPKEIIEVWKQWGKKELLPVQQKALKKGLLENDDLLVVAGTSSGKTFVGELAGIHNLLHGKGKFLFLTPLVALTNQKHKTFQSMYQDLGFRVGIRVGMNRLDTGDDDEIILDTDIVGSDIIVGTFEAIDWILRSGQWKKLVPIGTIVIDEFQVLAEEERGPEIDGLLLRLRNLFPKAQIIALSATIGNKQEIADYFNFRLISYEKRPIPLERHVFLLEEDYDKSRAIKKLIREELEYMKKRNLLGQTIVFTNTRRKCEQIAEKLRNSGVKAAYYHSGLTFKERKTIEFKFEKGWYEAIVTTAALGAGVDFAASQVIFETPGMGARWLTVAEFHQMMGRAGRYGKHHRGKVVLLLKNEMRLYGGQKQTEDEVGFSLLTSPIEAMDGDASFEQQSEQALATLSAKTRMTPKILSVTMQKSFYFSTPVKKIEDALINMKMMIHDENKNLFVITKLGREVSSSFLTPVQGLRIARELRKKDPLQLLAEILPFENLHLSKSLHARLEQSVGVGISSRVFSGIVSDVFRGERFVTKNLDKSTLKTLMDVFRVLYPCNHKNAPDCECGPVQAAKLILELRIEKGIKSLKRIGNILEVEYNVYAYPGDLLTYFEEALHLLDAIRRIAKVIKAEDVAQNVNDVLKQVETPRRKKKAKGNKK